MNFNETPALNAWALAAVFLFFKMLTISLVQGAARLRTRHFGPNEDTKFYGRRGEGPEPEIITRAAACWRNDLENIPMFLLVALAAVAKDLWPAYIVWFFFTFCAARTIHTVAYLRTWQPWRTFAYIVATACTAILALGIIYQQFGA